MSWPPKRPGRTSPGSAKYETIRTSERELPTPAGPDISDEPRRLGWVVASMPVKFDQTLDLRAASPGDPADPEAKRDPGGVDAKGPVDAGEEVEELCAWVFQRRGESDAAATEMSTTGGVLKQPGGAGSPWSMALGKVPEDGTLDLEPGPALALAVALMKAGENLTVTFWGQTVTLRQPQSGV
jgi:hypothetical protein